MRALFAAVAVSLLLWAVAVVHEARHEQGGIDWTSTTMEVD